MKKTAVEWLIEQYESNFPLTIDAMNQAKAMEKEQIMRAHSSGYNSGIENKIVLSYEYYIKTFKAE